MMEVKKDPTGYITFVFGMQMIMSWFMNSGLFTGDSYLYYGLFSIVCFPIYLQSGKDFMAMGDTLSATLYYMFGTLFAGTMGVCYVAQWMDGIFQWGLEYNFVGSMVLVSAIFLIPVIVMCVYMPWTEFLTWLLITVVMLIWGVSGFVGESVAYVCYTIMNPLCLIVGILLLYMSLVAIFKGLGVQLPVGKPLMKYPEESK